MSWNLNIVIKTIVVSRKNSTKRKLEQYARRHSPRGKETSKKFLMAEWIWNLKNYNAKYLFSNCVCLEIETVSITTISKICRASTCAWFEGSRGWVRCQYHGWEKHWEDPMQRNISETEFCGIRNSKPEVTLRT